MRLVVTAQGPRLDSPVDPRFGRAVYLILVDTDTGEHSAVDNAVNRDAPQGAGLQVSRKIAELNAEAVITGHVGPKAATALEACGITVYTHTSGTVGEALEQLKSGSLRREGSGGQSELGDPPNVKDRSTV